MVGVGSDRPCRAVVWMGEPVLCRVCGRLVSRERYGALCMVHAYVLLNELHLCGLEEDSRPVWWNPSGSGMGEGR